MRLLPLDLEGCPLIYHDYLDKARGMHPKPHIVIYWRSEYENGISLGRDSLK